jgi:hypothetical protein
MTPERLAYIYLHLDALVSWIDLSIQSQKMTERGTIKLGFQKNLEWTIVIGPRE